MPPRNSEQAPSSIELTRVRNSGVWRSNVLADLGKKAKNGLVWWTVRHAPPKNCGEAKTAA